MADRLKISGRSLANKAMEAQTIGSGGFVLGSNPAFITLVTTWSKDFISPASNNFVTLLTKSLWSTEMPTV